MEGNPGRMGSTAVPALTGVHRMTSPGRVVRPSRPGAFSTVALTNPIPTLLGVSIETASDAGWSWCLAP